MYHNSKRKLKTKVGGRLQLSSIKSFQLSIKDTFYEYTQTKMVNGMWMLERNRVKGFARWIWSLVLVQLLFLGAFLSLKLWTKFYSYPILNTIATSVVITDVAFPGITVCSPKVVNWEKVQKFVNKLEIPYEYDLEDVISGFEYLNAFTDQQWIAPNISTYKIVDKVLELNKISIKDAVLEVSAGCDDFFQNCYWGTTQFPCRQDNDYLSFTSSTSHLGPCCSFNYNPNNDSYVPFSSNSFGVNGGISFIGLEGSEKNVTTGLVVLIHHPMDFATESAASVTFKPEFESFVEILPTLQSSSPEVLDLAVDKRNCLTSNDVDLNTYRQATCLLSCQNEAIFKACGCHPYHLWRFKKGTKEIECKLKDAFCYTTNYDSFKSVKCDHCLPNCYDVTYATSSYNTDLRLHNHSVSGIHTNINLTDHSFIVRIYMAKQLVPSNRKVTVMSWISLLSDLGGVFSLCLGLSVISLVEFLYFFTFRLYRNYVARKAIIQVTPKLNNFY